MTNKPAAVCHAGWHDNSGQADKRCWLKKGGSCASGSAHCHPGQLWRGQNKKSTYGRLIKKCNSSEEAFKLRCSAKSKTQTHTHKNKNGAFVYVQLVGAGKHTRQNNISNGLKYVTAGVEGSIRDKERSRDGEWEQVIREGWVNRWIGGCSGACGLWALLSAEINTGRAQQHGLGFMGGFDWQCWHLQSTVNKVLKNK